MAKQTPKVQEPVITSFSFVRRNEGWSVVKITSQGLTVLSIEYSEPDVRTITQSQFKIAVANTLFSPTE